MNKEISMGLFLCALLFSYLARLLAATPACFQVLKKVSSVTWNC